MKSATYEISVGGTIFDQLASTSGGAGLGRLRAMLGATDFRVLKVGVLHHKIPEGIVGIGFRFKGCKKWNGIEIYLDRATDTYFMRFYKMQVERGRGTVLTAGEWVYGVYAEDLERIFRNETGLDTHL